MKNDPIETLFSAGTKCPNKYEHGDGDGDYRIVSSTGKIVKYCSSEIVAVRAYEQYIAAYPDEMDNGSSLQVWSQNMRYVGHPYRWTVIM